MKSTLLSFFILFLLLGCSKRPNGKSFSDLEKANPNFKTLNSDAIFSIEYTNNFNFKKVLGIDMAEGDSIPWITSTAEIFRLAEKSYLLGRLSEASDRVKYTDYANKIMNAFYDKRENTTQYSAGETLYLEAALGYEREKIINKFKVIGSRENESILEKIFNSPCGNLRSDSFCHSLVWPTAEPILEPKIFLESIKSYMLKTSEVMRDQGVSSEFVTLFENKIKTDYLSKIDTAIRIIKDVNPSREISLNTKDLVEATQYLDFLPESIHQILSKKLIPGNEYALILKGERPFSKDMAADIDETRDNEIMPPEEYQKALRVLNVIGNIWLDLDEPSKKFEYIGGANLILYETLLSQSTSFINWVAGRFSMNEYYQDCGNWGVGCGQEQYLPKTWRNGYVEKFANSCHSSIRKNIDLWLADRVYRTQLITSNPRLYKIFTSFQDTVFRDTILKNYTSEERSVEVENFEKEPTSSQKKVFKVTVSNFSVPRLGSSSTREIMKKFNYMVTPICLDEIQVRIEQALNNYILSSLDVEIRKYTQSIESIVSKQTLNSQKDIAQALESDSGFKSYFEKMAFPIIDKMLFAGKTLHGLENGSVILNIDKNKNLTTSLQDLTKFITGGEVLGQGLAANYYRLLELPKSQGVSPVREIDERNPNAYYTAVFEQVNKMLALIGFRKMDKTQHPSLHRRFFGPLGELDVYKYDCNLEKYERQKLKMEKYKKTENPEDYVDWRENCEGYTDSGQSFFNVPDSLEIFKAFQPGADTAISSSVRSQTEIIRGASLMLKYFKDWGNENSDFDIGMGKEQYAGQNIFPKSAFVNLSIALATLPIRGFTKEHSNLMLFSAMGNEFVGWAKTGKPPQGGPDPVAMAAIGDVFSNGTSRIIKASDLARFIIAISEFLEATDGIENTEASVINPPSKKERDNLKSLMEGRKLLKLMIIGVANFLTSQFQDGDGGFWHTFDLDKKSGGKMGELVGKENSFRRLDDQVLIIEALIRTYDLWGGTGVYMSILEAYHFMNSKLFDLKMGYYSKEEGHFESIQPTLFLETILVLRKISEIHYNYESKKQARNLADFYEEQWLNWIQ